MTVRLATPATPRLAALARAVRVARARDRWRCRVTLSNLAAGATPLIAFARGAEARLSPASGVLADAAKIALCVAIMPSSSVSRSTLPTSSRRRSGNVTRRSS
jgi:hypothetical protein